MKIKSEKVLKRLENLFPGRYREIPLAENPDKILIKQLAVLKKHVYLQSFVNGEGDDFVHSHSWKYGTIAVGLLGRVTDYNLGTNETKTIKAPYFRYMPPSTLHSTNNPVNHLSIFIGLGQKIDDLKGYVAKNKIPWNQHIKKFVKRL